MSIDQGTKNAMLRLRREEAQRFARSIATLESQDCFVAPEHVDLAEPSIGTRLITTCLPFLFFRAAGQQMVQPVPGTAVDATAVGSSSGPAARLFQRGPSVTDKLALVQKRVEARVESLDARAEASRAQAKSLMQSGKKSEAMAALKRSRALTSSSTALHAQSLALEQQMDAVDSANIQSEMTASLNLALKASKKATKGLLGKTERAVETGSELVDQADDVRQLFSELRVGSIDDDEDELAAELESMLMADTASDVKDVAPLVAPQSRLQISAYPSTPHAEVLPPSSVSAQQQSQAVHVATASA